MSIQIGSTRLGRCAVVGTSGDGFVVVVPFSLARGAVVVLSTDMHGNLRRLRLLAQSIDTFVVSERCPRKLAVMGK